MLLDYDEDIKTLIQLGLTLSQARVYVSAARLGKAKAKDLSEESGVGRQELYRILSELFKIGLIEKEISNPTQFIALPLSKGALALFDRKRDEVIQLETKTRVLMCKNNEAQVVEESESQLCLLPRKYLMENKGGHSYANAKKCIRFFAAFERLEGAFAYNTDVYIDALERGVEMRVITEKVDDNQYVQLKNVAASLFSRKSFNVKFVHRLDNLAISIIDDKEAYFALDPKKTIFDDMLLWTNNKSMTALASHYFDGVWSSALEP